MIRKLFSFAIAMLFFNQVLPAQQIISGIVVDSESGEPLPSANILIKDTFRGTITNFDGEFTLTLEDEKATLVFRYIGYKSTKVRISENSDSFIEVALEPSILEMDEIVVTDKDPGLSIMERVIERKKIWKEKLKTFEADAYTRQKLENDTSIVSITESVSKLFWDSEEGHREVIKSRNQTSNISENQNFAGVNYIPNFYDDNIEIAGFEMVGVTHPDALNFYDFKLIETLTIDEKAVYEIEVLPKRKLQPTFEGRVYVLDDDYALLEVKLIQNRVVNFPPPVQDFNLSYEQQFNNYGGDFWLPVDMRVTGDILIEMIGLRFPSIRFSQVSTITDYEINVELPDSLYKKEEVFSVDSVSVENDSLVAFNRIERVPLTTEEERAYSTIDSTQTLEKAFKPTGFLADMIDDDDDESGSSFFGRTGEFIPSGFGVDLHFNRVDGFHLGGSYKREILNTQLKGFTAYNTNTKFWDYGGEFSRKLIRGGPVRVTLTGLYRVDTESRYESLVYSSTINTVTSFFGARDYFDYYRSERFTAGFETQFPAIDLTAGFKFINDYQKSVSEPDVLDYSLFGLHSTRRKNPGIQDGILRSLKFDLELNYESTNFGFTGRRQAALRVEHSADWLNSDFSFTTGRIELDYNIPTFFPRRLFANTLDVHVSAGTSFGTVPHQRFGSIDASVASFTPFGTIKTLRHLPYEGDEFWLITAEHNFRTIPFEWLGLWKLADKGVGIIVFGGAAESRIRSESDVNFENEFGFTPNVSDGVHYEAGISINNILGVARLDFAKRLDTPGFFIGFSVPRIF